MSRAVPQNIEAEQALLGAIMVNNHCLDDVRNFLRDEDFHEPVHREVYRLVIETMATGKSANPVTLKPFFSDQTKVGTMNMMQYMAKLAAEAVYVSDVSGMGRAVYDMARLRDLLSLTQGFADSIAQSGANTSPWDVISSWEGSIRSTTSTWSSPEVTAPSMGDAVDLAFSAIDNAYQFKKRSGYTTGVDAVDQLTGPWEAGQQIIIGGGTKQGKSALAMQCVIGLASFGPVYVYSGEMSLTQLAMREIARRTGIPVWRQKEGKVSEREWESLVHVRADISRLPIFIEKKRLTLDQIHQKAREMKQGKGLVSMCIDHVGLLSWPKEMQRKDEWELSQQATLHLKEIYEDLKIPGMSLVQLKKNTFAESYGKKFEERLQAACNRRPRYTDLMGAVERDADHVIMPFNVSPILAGLEPAEGTEDHLIWEKFHEKHKDRAEIILSLSREQQFPARREVEWHGSTTSFGPRFQGRQEALFEVL